MTATTDHHVDPDGPPTQRGDRPVRPTGWLWPLVGAALALIGLGAVLLAGSVRTKVDAQLIGDNRPVNAGAADPTDLSAHNSPTVVQDPTNPDHIVVADRIDSPRFSCALHVSADGGATFTQQPIPIPDAVTEPKCYAPDVAYGPDGTLYLLFVTLVGRGNRPDRVWLSRSDDGGATLSTPTQVLGELAFQVRLTADPTRPGRLYLTWLQAADTATLAFPDTGYPIQFAISDDGGDSWSDPSRISPDSRERVVAPTLVAGPDGQLTVAYLDLADDRLDWAGAHEGQGGSPYAGVWHLVAARSTDGGDTWTETTIGDVHPPERIIVFLPDFPALAVDRTTGRLYAAFHTRTGTDADVQVWRSTNAGASWSAPTVVNHTGPDDTTAQYQPQLAVAPTGRVDVVYYDRRDDPDNVDNAVSLAWSTDGGVSFSDRLVVSDQTFSSQIGFGSIRQMADLGSRLALLTTADRALPVWTDTRAGTPASGKQDVVRQVVGLRPATLTPTAAAAVKVAGWMLIVAGVLLAVVVTVRRRRRAQVTTP